MRLEERLVPVRSNELDRLLRNRSSATRYFAECLALASIAASFVVTFSCVALTESQPNPVAAVSTEQPLPGGSSAWTGAESSSANEAIPINLPVAVSSAPADQAEPDAKRPSVGSTLLASETRARFEQLARLKSWTAYVVDPWLNEVCLLWFIGMLLLSARPVIGWHGVRRFQRQGRSEVDENVVELVKRLSDQLRVRRVVDVFQSSLAEVPTVIGWLSQ